MYTFLESGDGGYSLTLNILDDYRLLSKSSPMEVSKQLSHILINTLDAALRSSGVYNTIIILLTNLLSKIER